MRHLISEITALWDICRREEKRTWRPWVSDLHDRSIDGDFLSSLGAHLRLDENHQTTVYSSVQFFGQIRRSTFLSGSLILKMHSLESFARSGYLAKDRRR